MVELYFLVSIALSAGFLFYLKSEKQEELEKQTRDQQRAEERKLAKEERIAKEKELAEEEKRAEIKLAEIKLSEIKLADEELAKKIAVARRADKLELAQTVSCQIDLKKLRLAVAFFEDEERTSLVVEQNEQLHDSYVKEIKNFLEFDSQLNSENVLSGFIEDIKELGVSLVDKSLNSDSFRSLLEGRDVEANNPLKSSDSEKVEDSDKQSKPLSLAQLIAVVGDSKVANETSQAALETDPVVNGQKEPEEGVSSKRYRTEVVVSDRGDAETKSVSPNYFTRHWKGENSLVWAYWVNGVALNLVVLFLMTIISETEGFGFNGLIVILMLVYPLLIWSWVGIWQSAGNYLNQSKLDFTKSPTWAYLARFGVILGALQSISGLVDAISLYEVGNSALVNQYFVEFVDDTDIKLTGYINDDSVSLLISHFEQNPKRNALIMNSPGGILSSAFKLADYIEANDIVVGAQEKCFSACLLLMASSSTAVASTKSELAFHHPEDVPEFISSEMIQAGFEAKLEYYERFRRYGVSEENLKAYRKEGWVNLSLGQAYEANILDLIWEEDESQFYKASEFCQSNNCFTIPVLNERGEQKSIFDLSVGDLF